VRGKSSFGNPTSLARLERAKQLAGQLKATTNQVALAYLMAQPFPVIPILGTADAQHLADSLAAADLQLTPQQANWLREGTA
jgi:aryl-alcohol dehydrogenase-like predicted oxidoreductase